MNKEHTKTNIISAALQKIQEVINPICEQAGNKRRKSY